MKSVKPLLQFLALFAVNIPPCLPAAAESNVVRGADELFWVPTLEQGLDMAKITGRPLFLMGYSLVGDGSTYSKIGEDYCTGVF